MRRHCAHAASASSMAKAVAMKAETSRRPLLPACPSELCVWPWDLDVNRRGGDYQI